MCDNSIFFGKIAREGVFFWRSAIIDRASQKKHPIG